MATWKKVIVSGSQAELATLKVDNLTDQQVVIGGGSAANLSTRAINGTGNILATTGSTGVSMTGSFSGSISATSLRASLTQLATPNYVSFDLATNTLYYNLTSSFGVNITGGPLITGNGSVVSVNTSSLATNQIPKYINNTLSGSNISDTGTQVQIAAGATSGLSVAAGGVNVTGDSTFANNVTVNGDLAVNGTTTFINTTNTYIKDQFVLIASGSTTLTDAGIIAQYAANLGSAIYLEAGSAGSTGTYGRWAVAYGIDPAATSVTQDEFIVSAKTGQTVNPSAAPTWGGSTSNGAGNMWINDTTGDIFIYS
jgi:hypothetical protein